MKYISTMQVFRPKSNEDNYCQNKQQIKYCVNRPQGLQRSPGAVHNLKCKMPCGTATTNQLTTSNSENLLLTCSLRKP